MAEKRLGDQQNDPNQSDCILLPTCKRSRGSRIASTQCPVCGLTLREGQFQQHYEAEVEKVALLRTKKRKHRPSIGEDGREDGESSKQKSASDRAENVLTEVRRHRLVWRCTNPLSRIGNSPQDGQMCPLCGENVPGTADDLISHVDACIQRNGPDVSDALSEEDDLGTYEEYEWAGQTRIRVSTLVPPSALPDHVVVKRQGGGEGEGLDADVDIEGDGDVDDFGPHQYEEGDLIPCGSDSSEDEGERKSQGGGHVDQCSLPGEANTDTRTSEGSCSVTLSDQRGGAVNTSDERGGAVNTSDERGGAVNTSDERGGAVNTAASPSRKNKGRVPQHVYQLQLKCPVCMDSYRDPVASVKCWHVFCEECWLRALGAKKLCPKCNLITAASDLRRIYL